MVARVALGALCAMAAPADAAAQAPHEARLAGIHAEAKKQFFAAVATYLGRHPAQDQLTAGDAVRLMEAEGKIPFLFERLMNLAYQKSEPAFRQLLEKGDEDSLARFTALYTDLARDYAGRFVGSLFRRGGTAEFEMTLPHNRGKSRLDLVLQSLGYNAKVDPPDLPKDRWFRNLIEADFRSQWAADALNLRKAHARSTGKGIVVAVIDSGLDPTNSLFQGKVVPGFTLVQRTLPPWATEPLSTVDWGWHGTATASMVMLAAPDARIMPIRSLDSDTMNDPPYDFWPYETIAAGIYYAVNHGADVISISAVLPATEPVLADAVRYAYKKNVVLCTGAGNIAREFLGIHTGSKQYRAFDGEVVLAGGAEKHEEGYGGWAHSVTNPLIDVVTPSHNVFFVVPQYLQDVRNGYGSGTSLAVPLAAGVVALMKSAAPPTPALLKKPAAYVQLIAKALRESARLDLLNEPEPNDWVGHGLVDALGAIEAARRMMPVDRPAAR
ncbi:MAG: S8 family serine peptidase [Acidobacteria bacterium]|nr:S8 family serine peptidase [Acidobacteriota bacterium]